MHPRVGKSDIMMGAIDGVDGGAELFTTLSFTTILIVSARELASASSIAVTERRYNEVQEKVARRIVQGEPS